MAKRLVDLTEELSLDQLKALLKVKEEMTRLEDRRAKVTSELEGIDARLDELRRSIGGAPAGRRKAKAPRRATRKKAAKKSSRTTVAGVVAEVIRAKGRAMTFTEIRTTIVKGKLIKTKSKNFDNVLRRTLSTAAELKRVARGVYGVRGVTTLPPASSKAAAGKKTAKKKVAKKKVAKKKVTKRKATKKTVVKKKVAKKKVVKKKATKKKVAKKKTAKKTTKKKAGAKANTVESVVLGLLKKAKGPLSFQDILSRITEGKLVKTKSKNFANVLRRTLSTSKNVKRPSRGVYALKG